MPSYEHLCSSCNTISEHICKIAERKQFIPCPQCGGSAERVITAQIQRVEPTWLESAKRQLQPDSRDQIRDRNDLHRHMAREGIVQIG